MIWPIAFLFAALLGIFAAEVEARVSTPPELVIVCERGGVSASESHLASGSTCVLHDRSGSATSAGAISVYSDEMTVPQVKRCLAFTLACGVLGADEAVVHAGHHARALLSTALQLGIASTVGVMLILQSKIAERDDAVRVQQPRCR